MLILLHSFLLLIPTSYFCLHVSPRAYHMRNKVSEISNHPRHHAEVEEMSSPLTALYDLSTSLVQTSPPSPESPLGGAPNTTYTLLQLIALGDEWRSRQDQQKQEQLQGELGRGVGVGAVYQRVPGCMADSRLHTSLRPDQPHYHHGSPATDTDNNVQVECVSIAGYADSRVAQGMLALLAQGLEGVPVTVVADIDVDAVVARCTVAAILPQGRYNGFRNMLQLIRDQAGLLLKDRDALRTDPLTSTTQPYTEEVAVLLSGGVDSSVALKLLLNQGYSVRAFYLKIWLEDEIAHLNECPWEEDLNYAQAVCSQLQVPLEAVSLQREYWDEVVTYTFQEARRGRTPNPDIMCNSRVKFGVFFDYIGRYFSKVATGHYAQILPQSDDTVHLASSPDPVKDQSYFLSNLRQEQLQKCLFPIGHLHKSRVRELAEEFDLPTKTRKDSQGICFLGKLKFDEFIGHYLGTSPGLILDYSSEREMGRHRGLWFHTIGQRKGVGLLLKPSTVHDGPWFVAAKDVARNVLYVTNDLSVIDRPRRRFRAERINWNSGVPDAVASPEGAELLIKLRHGPGLAAGRVWLRRESAAAAGVLSALPGDDEVVQGGERSYLDVELAALDKGIAPGQFAALYRADGVCLGAAVISETARDTTVHSQ